MTRNIMKLNITLRIMTLSSTTVGIMTHSLAPNRKNIFSKTTLSN